jgi:hypothetical protein
VRTKCWAAAGAVWPDGGRLVSAAAADERHRHRGLPLSLIGGRAEGCEGRLAAKDGRARARSRVFQKSSARLRWGG